MLDDLEAAMTAFREAQAAVVDAQEQLAEAKARVPDARARVAEAIVSAARAGVRQSDIARVTGYGREQVRRITRAGGVEA
jgi:hypothetical protein